MNLYLRSTDVIDWNTQSVKEHARFLAGDVSNTHNIVRLCFEWVRDNITHSGDSKATITLCRASEVLKNGTGWCFSKSHLLAALLRANVPDRNIVSTCFPLITALVVNNGTQ